MIKGDSEGPINDKKCTTTVRVTSAGRLPVADGPLLGARETRGARRSVVDMNGPKTVPQVGRPNASSDRSSHSCLGTNEANARFRSFYEAESSRQINTQLAITIVADSYLTDPLCTREVLLLPTVE